MASIIDLLLSTQKRPEEYLLSNPYFTTGHNIASMQLPTPKNNTEAIAGGLIQGLLSGGLMGYGQKQAKESAFSDVKKSPLFSALAPSLQTTYNLGAAPKDWDMAQGGKDLLLAALQKQQAQEAAAAEEEKKDKITFELLKQGMSPQFSGAEVVGASPLPGIEEAKTRAFFAQEEAKALADQARSFKKSEFFDNIPKEYEKEALAENEKRATNQEIIDTVNQMYDEMKDLSSFDIAMGSIPLIETKAKNKANAISANLKFLAQKAIGTEPGPRVQEQLNSLSVTAQDTKESLEDKKKSAIRFFKSIARPTPVLDKYEGALDWGTKLANKEAGGGIDESKIRSRASELKAQGKSKSDIAATLRSEFGG